MYHGKKEIGCGDSPNATFVSFEYLIYIFILPGIYHIMNAISFRVTLKYVIFVLLHNPITKRR